MVWQAGWMWLVRLSWTLFVSGKSVHVSSGHSFAVMLKGWCLSWTDEEWQRAVQTLRIVVFLPEWETCGWGRRPEGVRVCVYCQLGIKEMHLTSTSIHHYVKSMSVKARSS